MKQNYWNLKNAEQINIDIAQLPKAEIFNLISAKLVVTESGEILDYNPIEPVPKFRTVRVTEHSGKRTYVQCCTDQYEKVDHDKAFMPIIDALKVAGQPFRYTLTATPETAKLWLFTEGTDFYDTVSVGFEISNSFHGHTTLNYGLKLDSHKRYIEIVGYRKVCSNGAVMRVPLDVAEFVRPELRDKIVNLASYQFSFKHTENVMLRVEAVKYMTEAISLLREPVERMIKKGETVLITPDNLKDLIKVYVGKRYANKVEEAFTSEQPNLWGFYNAMTYVASHEENLKDSARNTLMQKASTLLYEQLITAIRA